MDEPASPAVNTPVVEDNNVATSPVVEPTTSDSPTIETPEAPAPVGPEPKVETPVEEPERQQPRPAERKIKKLLDENKQLKDQLSTNPIPQFSPQIPKISELIKPDEYGNVDPSQLDKVGEEVYQNAAQTARGLSGLEVQQLRQEMLQREAIAETERDASVIAKDYDELNPDSPSYNPALEEKVVGIYQQLAVRPDPTNPQRRIIDPSIKLTAVAKDLVELARASAETGKAQTTATLARQADEAAVIPSSDSPVEKSFSEMSLQEQETYLKAKGHDI